MEVRTILAVAAMMAALACGRPAEGPVRTTTDQGTSQAPGDAALTQQEQALIRMVHAMPDVPKADVYAGDKKAFSGVDFGTVTPYIPVSEQSFKLALKPAGQDTAPPMLEAQEGVDTGRRYTIFAIPDRGGAAKLDVVTDDVAPPAPGKAKLRLIHAAPDAGPVDVVATAGAKREIVIDNVDFGSPPTYREVDASEVVVEVQAKGRGGKGAALARQPEQLQSGKIYTMVLAAGGEAGQPIDVIKVEDHVQPAEAAGTELQTGKEPAVKTETIDDDYEIQPDVEGLKKQPQK